MKVECLAPAENDIREIAMSVAINFGYDTAEKTVSNIVAMTSRLSDFSELGRLCDEYHNTTRQYRVLRTRHNRIVYTITEDCVLITAVFDNRRNPDTLGQMLNSRDENS